MFLISYHIDLSNYIYSRLSYPRVYWKGYTSLHRIDRPWCSRKWWVIHSSRDAATNYAIFRRVQYGVMYWLNTARLDEFTYWKYLKMRFACKCAVGGYFILFCMNKYWFGGIDEIELMLSLKLLLVNGEELVKRWWTSSSWIVFSVKVN